MHLTTRHPFVYQENIIRDIILDQELMVNDYYLQNRTFTKDRDIECAGKMVVGNDVLPLSRYLYNTSLYNTPANNLNTSETKKSQELGDVMIKAGSSVLLEAKSEIAFTPGFKVENGAILAAKVDGTNPNSRSSIKVSEPCGRITQDKTHGVYRLSNISQTLWTLRGYNLNYTMYGSEFTLPSTLKKGQYSLHAESAGCEVASIVVSVQKSSKENKPKPFHKNDNIVRVQMFPNPTKDLLNIVADLEIEQLVIGDLNGKEIVSQKPNVKDYKFSIGDLSNGTYYIKITLKNGETYAEKLLISN